MYDNSIIVIVSDHVEEFLDHGWIKHGETLYGEQLRVPLILKVPGQEPNAVDKMVNHIDMIPTLLPLIGISVPEDLDGMDVFSDQEREVSYAQLESTRRVFISAQTEKEKIIQGVFRENYLKKQYNWFEDEIVIRIFSNDITLQLLSFFNERTIRVSINDKVLGDVTVFSEVAPLKLPIENMEISPQNPAFLKLTSLDPCKKVSDFGATDTSRCISFGLFGNIGMDETNAFLPFYGYFKLDQDAKEQKNLYHAESYQEDIRKLEDNLATYMKTKRKNVLSEVIEYNEDQLDALRALGYI